MANDTQMSFNLETISTHVSKTPTLHRDDKYILSLPCQIDANPAKDC